MWKQIIYSICLSGLLFTFCLPLKAERSVVTEDEKKIIPDAGGQRKLDYFYYEGLNLKSAGKYDAAFEAFTHCLSIDSTAAPVLFELATFYIQMNQPETAVRMLKQAVANSPDNFTYKLTLAALTRSIGMYGEAVETYEELVKKYPSKVDLNYYRAEALTQQGEIDKAIEAYNALELSMGMNEALSIQKYRLYNMLEEPEKALQEIEKLAAKYPMEARYQIILGDLHLEQKDLNKALKAYEKAYEIDPADPYYIVGMANYYEATGDKGAAEQEIQNALVNEKLDVETKVSILSRYIQSLYQSGQSTEHAVSLFESILEQHPEDTELKMMYSGLLMTQDKNEEAKFQLQLVTEMEPENIDAWNQLLQLSLRSEDIPELIRVCKRCIELFPEAALYYFYLGIGYSMQEENELALETLYEGIENVQDRNNPIISDFYSQIGQVYYQMEDMDKTFEAYDEALKYNERNILVLNNYAYFLSLAKKDLPKAERMSAQTIKMEPENSTYLDTYAWIFFMQGNYTLAKIYIERAISNDDTGSTELVDHYGDILYMTGEKEKAVEQWKKAKELGKESEVLDRKIKEERYIEDENAK